MNPSLNHPVHVRVLKFVKLFHSVKKLRIFLFLGFYVKSIWENPEWQNTALHTCVIETLVQFTYLISRKILKNRKILKFPHCVHYEFLFWRKFCFSNFRFWKHSTTDNSLKNISVNLEFPMICLNVSEELVSNQGSLIQF